ncbi:MAG TPA: AMP-binding protein [Trueperaceae bacterium]|nr:AMP-binding protein [Trueperaceae bacterium]
MLDPEARRQALEERLPEWPRRTLATHFEAVCRDFAERPFLLLEEGALSYADVWARAQDLARALLALGVKRRQHVAVLMANVPEFVTLKLAIALLGAVCVPLNSMLRRDELAYVLDQSDARWLFLHETIGGNRAAEAVQDIFAEVPQEVRLGVVCIPTEGGAIDPSFLRWDAFEAMAGDATPEDLAGRRAQSEYPDEISDIIYTSGTTGQPKGVLLTHDMLLRCAFSSALSRAFEDGRRIFTALPLYHVFAYVEGLMAVSFVGGAMVVTPGFSPRGALQLIERHRASDCLAVPSMVVAMLNEEGRERFDTSSLNALLCAAAPTPVPVWQAAVEAFGLEELCTGYGGTEATAATVHTEIGDPIERVATRVGRIKPGGSSGLPEFGGANSQYKVVDPFTGEDLEAGATGELTVRGNFVTHGYYDKPEETAAVIDKDGWFRTGDLGRIDENGYIEFMGRSNEMYKVSGENVSPKEVEEVISQHPAVSQVYVVGIPDTMTTEAGAAFVELKSGSSADRKDIVEWCQQRLARFKVPRRVWFVASSEWPMTGTGKIQKFKLRHMAEQRLGGSRPASAGASRAGEPARADASDGADRRA